MGGIVLSGVPFAGGPAERIRLDAQGGKPLVAHVVVAICDNAHQGIVPVARALGDGQDAGRNLYWGARFGMREYLRRAPGWKRIRIGESGRARPARSETAVLCGVARCLPSNEGDEGSQPHRKTPDSMGVGPKRGVPPCQGFRPSISPTCEVTSGPPSPHCGRRPEAA